MATSALVIRMYIETAEADGSMCMVCQDMVFLKAFRVALYSRAKRIGQVQGLICQSCGDEFTSRTKGG